VLGEGDRFGRDRAVRAGACRADRMGGQPPHRLLAAEERVDGVHHPGRGERDRMDGGGGGQVAQLSGYCPGVGDEDLLGGVQGRAVAVPADFRVVGVVDQAADQPVAAEPVCPFADQGHGFGVPVGW
jgi:hypothetical protein